MVDYCVAVAGSRFDCSTIRRAGPDTAPDDNTVVSNVLTNNGTDTGAVRRPCEPFAADITYVVLDPERTNCFAGNTYATFVKLRTSAQMAKSCD